MFESAVKLRLSGAFTALTTVVFWAKLAVRITRRPGQLAPDIRLAGIDFLTFALLKLRLKKKL
jgi:hypothetical protein